jgi:hypothetical protein
MPLPPTTPVVGINSPTLAAIAKLLRRVSVVYQRGGTRPASPPFPSLPSDSAPEHLAGQTLVSDGDCIVFAKFNINNSAAVGTTAVNVVCELRVGTESDRYEMLGIPGKSVRSGSLIVGAHLAELTEAKVVFRCDTSDASINLTNLVIASVLVDGLRLEKQGESA